MFTGLIEEIGIVKEVSRQNKKSRLTISGSLVLRGVSLGDSIAVNGCCQTVVNFTQDSFTVEAYEQTLKKTNLGQLKKGDSVNLESSLTLERKLGGHIVQGHVNAIAPIVEITQEQENIYLTVALPQQLERYAPIEGSITLDGISLTIANIEQERVTINVISHTWQHTNLKNRKVGDNINIEVDIIGRYVEKLLYSYTKENSKKPLTLEKLKEKGF